MVNMNVPHMHYSHIQTSKEYYRKVRHLKVVNSRMWFCLWLHPLIVWSHTNFSSGSFSPLVGQGRSNAPLLNIHLLVQCMILCLICGHI